MEDLHWFDQKTALFIADSLDICERINDINQKILEQLETATDSPEELAQLKHLVDDQELRSDQAMSDRQNQQDSDRKVIYLLLPSCFLFKHDEFPRQDKE